MSLVLFVDGDRWRGHLRGVAEATPGLVPVAKGNGYGFGVASLARRCEWLGVDAIAVGTYDEIADVADRFGGDIVVLTPWRPWVSVPDIGRRLIHTVSRAEDVPALLVAQPGARMVLERATSMLRHGMSAADLITASAEARRLGARVEGVTIHLPMQGGNLAEARRLMDEAVAAEPGTVWVSHLTRDEVSQLGTAGPGVRIRPRIGTDLWLGDRGALTVRARVLDVHAVDRGDRVGYRQAKAGGGHVIVVSGGTAHGIGLEAPSGDSSLRGRAVVAAKGAIEAAGTLRSPFTLGGRELRFVEPPHMQASMLEVPRGAVVPAVGDWVDVAVRFTATTFDEVSWV